MYYKYNNSLLYKKNKKACLNCGQYTHLAKNCHLPTNSYGAICYKIIDGEFKYLMVQRKHSFNFIGFMKGSYNIYNVDNIIKMFSYMTHLEKYYIKTLSFDELWNYTWQNYTFYKNNFQKLKKNIYNKYLQLINGVNIIYNDNIEVLNLDFILTKCTNLYYETEWGFPKGKKNNNIFEKDLDCALRELYEETKIDTNNIHIINKDKPINENFIGTDNKKYCSKYFIIKLNNNNMYNLDYNDLLQISEIEKISFFTKDEIINKFRHYDYTHKQIIIKIDNLLHNLYNL
jgi:8-oxo-dGTP pyrophosphatase MutT (NUDIX family)